MRTKSLLLSLITIPVLAQVSRVGLSESKDTVPAFDSSGAITLPAARLKLDVAYPKGRKERCELTIVYDQKYGHYFWHRAGPVPDGPDDTRVSLKMMKAGEIVAFADPTGLSEFLFGDTLSAKTWKGRAASLVDAVVAAIDDVRLALATWGWFTL